MLVSSQEKLLKTVLIPDGNLGDLKEIPEKIKDNLQIKPVKWIDEVFKVVFTEEPKPWVSEKEENSKTQKISKNKKNKLETH